MTLSLCSEIRYTANAKSSAFYLPDVLMLWLWYNNRRLTSAKNRWNNVPANSGSPSLSDISNNSGNRCARRNGSQGGYVVSSATPKRHANQFAAWCLRRHFLVSSPVYYPQIYRLLACLF